MEEVETCEMCGQVLRRVWKMKIPGKEELHGVYCSKSCVEADIYGPSLKGACPKFAGVFKSAKFRLSHDDGHVIWEITTLDLQVC